MLFSSQLKEKTAIFLLIKRKAAISYQVNVKSSKFDHLSLKSSYSLPSKREPAAYYGLNLKRGESDHLNAKSSESSQ